MLHPAGARIDLRKFLLRYADNILCAIKNDGSAGGRSLIERNDIFFHVFPPPSLVIQLTAADEFTQQRIRRNQLFVRFRKLMKHLYHILQVGVVRQQRV